MLNFISLAVRQLQTDLARKSIAGLAIQFCFAGLGFMQAVLLARMLGAENYGVFAFAMAIISILVIPSASGLPMLVVRETAKAKATEEWEYVRGIWCWSGRLSLAIAVVISLMLALIVYLFHDVKQDSTRTLLIGCLLLILLPAIRLKGSSLQGLGHVTIGQLPEKIIYPTIIIGLLVYFYSWSPDIISPIFVISLFCFSAVISFFAAHFMLKPIKARKVPLAENRFQHRAWVIAMLPLAMTSGMLVLNRYVDILMLGLLSSDANVGIYRVAAQVSLLVSFGLTAVNMAIAPRIAKHYRLKEMHVLQNIVAKTAAGVLIYTIPLTLLFYFYGHYVIVSFFGETYSPSFIPAMVLVLGQAVNSLAGPVGYLLNMTGHEKEVFVAVLISACTNIVLNIVLIPIYGMVGAAISTALSLSIWNLILWLCAKRRLNIDGSILAIFRG